MCRLSLAPNTDRKRGGNLPSGRNTGCEDKGRKENVHDDDDTPMRKGQQPRGYNTNHKTKMAKASKDGDKGLLSAIRRIHVRMKNDEISALHASTGPTDFVGKTAATLAVPKITLPHDKCPPVHRIGSLSDPV
jgi:hypothetical protein